MRGHVFQQLIPDICLTPPKLERCRIIKYFCHHESGTLNQLRKATLRHEMEVARRIQLDPPVSISSPRIMRDRYPHEYATLRLQALATQ